jgi:hypothetical protein
MMAERTKPEELTQEEISKFGNYSPEHIAAIVNASLFRVPGDSAAFRTFIDNIHKNEEFILQLMKTINPRSTAFFENVIGISETRKKESEENKRLKGGDPEQQWTI